jgi:uncharacterized protein
VNVSVRFDSGASVRATLVDRPEEMARGLMDRMSLPEDEGMLFWLGRRDRHSFWMKRTKIPLDLLFIDVDKVVGVLTLQPLDERQHAIDAPSNAVLEVNGGWAARHGVQAGSRVQITTP